MTAMTESPYRLLAGPDFGRGPERFADHLARLGELPPAVPDGRLIDELDRSGLQGRGGAGYPVGRKWRGVAARARRTGAVVIANGAEGEPLSSKDQALLYLRPHLVIDGGILAARSVRADRLRIYVGADHEAALQSVWTALAERPTLRGLSVELVEAPAGYVAGEASAVVRYLTERDARPMSAPPRPSERGVRGRPTLVQNVESLAYAALIARYGSAWYRVPGRGETRGTTLVTLTGPVASPGVREIAFGTTLRELLAVAGGLTEPIGAVLVGGYFGGWARAAELVDLPIDPEHLTGVGIGLGCGLISLLPARACGVQATAEIVSYMAAESARQCGPCIFGLGAMAEAVDRLATGFPDRHDLANLERWSAEIVGRGACHHPDGVAGLVRSGLRAFGPEFAEHQGGRCTAATSWAGEAA